MPMRCAEPRLVIIVPTFGNVDSTIEACLSATSSGYGNQVTIVVDDGSPEETQKRLARRLGPLSNVHLHVCSVNQGFAAACNAGADIARDRFNAQFVLFLNDDACLAPNAVQAMVEAFSSPDVGMVGPKIYFGSGPRLNSVGGYFDKRTLQNRERGWNVVDNGQFEVQQDVEFLMGAAFMVRADLYGELGGMDECYFMYSEEADLCLRASRLGYRLVYQPGAAVYHRHGMTLAPRSRQALYYSIRNRIYFVKKLGSRRQMLATVWMLHGSEIRYIFADFAKRLLTFAVAVWDGMRGNMGKRNGRLF